MREVKKDCGELTADNSAPASQAGVEVPDYAVIVELDAVIRQKRRVNGKMPKIPVRWFGRRRSDGEWERIPRTLIENLEKRRGGKYRIVVAAHMYDRIAPRIRNSSGDFRVKLEATFTE